MFALREWGFVLKKNGELYLVFALGDWGPMLPFFPLNGLRRKAVSKPEGSSPGQAALLERVAAMKQRLAQAEEGPTEVEQAQGQVGRMLGCIEVLESHVVIATPEKKQPTDITTRRLTSHVVIATPENLVEAAHQYHHKEADFYRRALSKFFFY